MKNVKKQNFLKFKIFFTRKTIMISKIKHIFKISFFTYTTAILPAEFKKS